MQRHMDLCDRAMLVQGTKGGKVGFQHTDDTMASEPPKAKLRMDRLPRIAYAHSGDAKFKSTWKYPHHFVYAPRNVGADGTYIDGTLVVHRDLLWHALHDSAADGDVAAAKHTQAHRANMIPDPIDRPHGRGGDPAIGT